VTASGPARHPWLICQEQAGEVGVPDGNLLEEEYVAVFHVPPVGGGSSNLGHLLVAPRRHCGDFAGLDRLVPKALGADMARCSAALKKIGAERVRVTTILHGI
jgi:hypothetical protein